MQPVKRKNDSSEHPRPHVIILMRYRAHSPLCGLHTWACGVALFVDRDILGLGEEGRMDTPGTTRATWKPRVQGSQPGP